MVLRNIYTVCTEHSTDHVITVSREIDVEYRHDGVLFKNLLRTVTRERTSMFDENNFARRVFILLPNEKFEPVGCHRRIVRDTLDIVLIEERNDVVQIC